MDINTLRSAITVVSLLTFVGIVFWALSRRNKAELEEAATQTYQDE